MFYLIANSMLTAVTCVRAFPHNSTHRPAHDSQTIEIDVAARIVVEASACKQRIGSILEKGGKTREGVAGVSVGPTGVGSRGVGRMGEHMLPPLPPLS